MRTKRTMRTKSLPLAARSRLSPTKSGRPASSGRALVGDQALGSQLFECHVDAFTTHVAVKRAPISFLVRPSGVASRARRIRSRTASPVEAWKIRAALAEQYSHTDRGSLEMGRLDDRARSQGPRRWHSSGEPGLRHGWWRRRRAPDGPRLRSHSHHSKDRGRLDRGKRVCFPAFETQSTMRRNSRASADSSSGFGLLPSGRHWLRRTQVQRQRLTKPLCASVRCRC